MVVKEWARSSAILGLSLLVVLTLVHPVNWVTLPLKEQASVTVRQLDLPPLLIRVTRRFALLVGLPRPDRRIAVPAVRVSTLQRVQLNVSVVLQMGGQEKANRNALIVR